MCMLSFPKTEKLYDKDSHATEFTGTVLASFAVEGGYETILDRSLFFPEEGGQESDTGTLEGEPVLAVALRGDGILYHKTAHPLPVGKEVGGKIEWESRFRKMQHHSAEHIVCGIAHRLYGCENVGFHLGHDNCTFDLNRTFTAEELYEIELLANKAIFQNLKVTSEYPAPEILSSLSYRSKLDLTEGVRIVTIDTVDRCACCAPHVKNTGEIGLLKLLDPMHYKGGTRIRLVAGGDALLDYRARYEGTVAISNLLSVKQNEVVSGVEKLKNDLILEKQSKTALKRRLLDQEIEDIRPTERHTLLFSSLLDPPFLVDFVNAASELSGGIAAAFYGKDETGYRYVMASKNIDLRANIKVIHSLLSGRGGGAPALIQGNTPLSEAEIRSAFDSLSFS